MTAPPAALSCCGTLATTALATWIVVGAGRRSNPMQEASSPAPVEPTARQSSAPHRGYRRPQHPIAPRANRRRSRRRLIPRSVERRASRRRPRCAKRRQRAASARRLQAILTSKSRNRALSASRSSARPSNCASACSSSCAACSQAPTRRISVGTRLPGMSTPFYGAGASVEGRPESW